MHVGRLMRYATVYPNDCHINASRAVNEKKDHGFTGPVLIYLKK
jgi:hypothetical protein